MLNILELVYGSRPTPDSNPIHVFDPERDMYEYAEFEKENGDFYQIVKISSTKVLYHFQKQDATILSPRLEGSWWLRVEDFTRVYENRTGIFYEKITDRINHGYRVKALVVGNKGSFIVPSHHPDFEEIMRVYSK